MAAALSDEQKRVAVALEKADYLPMLRELAMRMAGAFWWHGPKVDEYKIFHNGTISYVNTGKRILGITADHVYQEYLDDKARYDVIVCSLVEARSILSLD